MKHKSIIIVPLTECNLSCDYCFETKSSIRLGKDELQKIAKEINNYCFENKITNLSLYWLGGEISLLGVSWFEEMEKVFSKTILSTQISHYLQSNLIGINSDKWIKLIHKIFNSNISTSFDYPNKYRTIQGSTEHFQKIWQKNFNKFIDAKINVSVISVINSYTIKSSPKNLLKFYANTLGVTKLQINFPFSFDNQAIFLDNKQLKKFMVNLFEEWFKNWQDIIDIEPFKKLLINKQNISCIWSGNCYDNFFTIGPDGNVSLCDCFVTNKNKYIYGNLLNDNLKNILNSSFQKTLKKKRLSAIIDSDCLDCNYFHYCNGGCPARAYSFNMEMSEKDYYCETYKALFEKIISVRQGN